MLVIPRSEPKMPAEVAICLGHSPEWKSYTQSMFDIKVPNVYKSDRARIPRSRSISVKKCATLQNQLQSLALYPRTPPIQIETVSKMEPIRNTKRRVTFADAHGRPLFVEKIFTEAPDEPPQMRSDRLNGIMERLRLNLPADANAPTKTFEFSFPQPMSDYLRFKEKLDRDFVSLENIVCRHRSILGTIKVKNVSFEKSVTVRVTYNGWKTYEDIDADFIKNAYEGDWTNTFKFSAMVPPSYDTNKSIEFCIKYSTPARDYWDNNSGDNYRLICVNPALLSPDDESAGSILNPEVAPLSGDRFY